MALANAEGGVIVVGIATGQVEGLRNHLEKLNEFRQAPMDFTVTQATSPASHVAAGAFLDGEVNGLTGVAPRGSHRSRRGLAQFTGQARRTPKSSGQRPRREDWPAE